MNLLLTGASGSLGKRLAPVLIDQPGIRLHSLIHRKSLSLEGCTDRPGDLRDPASLNSALEGIDTVVHLAAVTHTNRVHEYDSINREGTEHLLQACKTNGVRRIVYISSRTAHKDGGAYALSKLQAEECIQQSGLAYQILRLGEVYGPGSPDAINRLFAWVAKYPLVPLIGNGQATLNPLFIDDALEGIVETVSLDAASSGTWELAGPEDISLNNIIRRMGKLIGVNRSTLPVPVPMFRAITEILLFLNSEWMARDQITRLICPKLKTAPLSELLHGFATRSLEDGLTTCKTLAPKFTWA